jgi:hypothetical protein
MHKVRFAEEIGYLRTFAERLGPLPPAAIAPWPIELMTEEAFHHELTLGLHFVYSEQSRIELAGNGRS